MSVVLAQGVAAIGSKTIVAGANVSITTDANNITIAAGGGTGGGGGDGYNIIGVNGNSVGTAATIQFSNSNNVVFGLNGSTVTASFNQSQQPIYYSGNNGSTSANTLVFADSNGVSFSTGTQGVYATVNTNYAATDHTHSQYVNTSQSSLFQQTSNTSNITSNAFPSANTTKFAGTGFTGTNISGTVNSNGIQLSVNPGGGAGDGYNILAAGTQTANTTGTVQFVNSNGISFGMTNNSQITASYTVPTQTVDTNKAGIGFSSTTTAGTAVVGTLNTNGLSLGVPQFLTTAAATNVTTNNMATSERNNYFYTSNNSFANNTHSHGNPTLALTNLSGTTASASNGLTISLSAAAPGGGGAINVSAGTTSGNLQTIQFDNSNGVTFGLDGSTVTASVNAGSGVGVTQDFWMPYPSGNNSSFLVPGQNTIYMQALHPPEAVGVSNVEFMKLYSYATSTNSCQAAMTIRYGLYEYNTGASSNSITQIATSSMSLQASYNSSTTGGFTIGNSASSFTSGTNGGSNLFASLSGPKYLYLPFTTTLAENKEYFWAMHFSSATTGNTGPLRLNMYVQTVMNSTVWGELKVNTAVGSGTNQWEEYDGMQYSATSVGLPTAVDKSNFQQMASKGRMFMMFENE